MVIAASTAILGGTGTELRAQAGELDSIESAIEAVKEETGSNLEVKVDLKESTRAEVNDLLLRTYGDIAPLFEMDVTEYARSFSC